jgi:hypothetical protein
MDRQHEALRLIVEKIALLTYSSSPLTIYPDDLRTQSISLLTLLNPSLPSHEALRQHADIAILKHAPPDWGFRFLELSQLALNDIQMSHQ